MRYVKQTPSTHLRKFGHLRERKQQEGDARCRRVLSRLTIDTKGEKTDNLERLRNGEKEGRGRGREGGVAPPLIFHATDLPRVTPIS